MNKTQLKKACKMYKALGDITRVSVLDYLESGPKRVKKIIKKLKIEPTLLSHHLSTLRKAGLVSTERDGKSIIYTAKFTLGKL